MLKNTLFNLKNYTFWAILKASLVFKQFLSANSLGNLRWKVLYRFLLIYLKFGKPVEQSSPENYQHCSGGGTCVIPRPRELYWWSFGFWQVSSSQAGQRVGSREIDDRITCSRARVVLTGRYNLVYSGCELLLFWGEHCNCW